MNNKEFKAEIVWLDPKELIPYPNNHKRHTAKTIDKLAGEIAAFGFDQPIVVDARNVIVKGHRRREASLKLGMKAVPCVVATHLDEYQIMAARMADNKSASDSEIDKDMLRFELGTLQRQDFDLNLTGFSLPEIDKLLDDDGFDGGGKGSSSKASSKNVEGANQFIVSVHCRDEHEMRTLFDEMVERGLECKLIQ